MIDILVPVLGRPQNAQPLVDSIHANTTVPHTIIFLATHGDEAEIEACKATGAIVHLVEPGPAEYARKINIGCGLNYTDHEWVFLGADDLRFHPDWDTEALLAAEESGALVIGTNDRGNPSVMSGQTATHSLVHRAYPRTYGTVDEPHKLLHEYNHNFVDSELVETAKSRDLWAFCFTSIVEHLHPFWRKAEDDRTYELGRRTYHADARTFRKRSALWR